MKDDKNQEEKQPGRTRRIARQFVPPNPIATKAIKEGAGVIGDLWRQVIVKHRPRSGPFQSQESPADFNELCRENKIDEKELIARRNLALRSKRLSWSCMLFMLIWCLLGVAAMIKNGPGWFSFSLVLLTLPLALLFFSMNFRYTLHLWQFDRREIAGVREFFQDDGVLRLLRF